MRAESLKLVQGSVVGGGTPSRGLGRQQGLGAVSQRWWGAPGRAGNRSSQQVQLICPEVLDTLVGTGRLILELVLEALCGSRPLALCSDHRAQDTCPSFAATVLLALGAAAAGP